MNKLQRSQLAKYRRKNPYGYIYKITNNINGRIYIGQCHYTPEETPDYIGSGRELIGDIKKYGKNNFSKKILEIGIRSFEKLENKEILWTKHYNPKLDPKIGYNKKMGNGSIISEKLLRQMSLSQKEWNPRKPLSVKHKKKLSLRFSGKGNPFYKKSHSKLSIEKMRNSKIEKKRKPFLMSTIIRQSKRKIGGLNPNSKKIICTVNKNKTKLFTSINGASRKLKITKGRLIYSLQHGISCDGYSFKYF